MNHDDGRMTGPLSPAGQRPVPRPPAPRRAATPPSAAAPSPSSAAAPTAPVVDEEEFRAVERYLEELTREAAESVGGSETPVSCGITVQIGEQRTSVAWSDAWASQLDEMQYEVELGPCLHALRTQQVVRIDDLERDAPWPDWRERAIAAGVRSALAVPAPVKGGPRAALNFYSPRHAAFDEAAIERAIGIAERAVRSITIVAWVVEQEVYTEQLRAALGSRSVIDQALGIIMGQNRCDADAAFLILRKASHNRNLKLRDVAAEMITNVTGRPPVSPPKFRIERRLA
jgi:hypothetical protein